MKSKNSQMTLDEARKVIRNDAAGYAAWAVATATIFYEANQNRHIYEDLLKCLERGGPCAGTASLALYSRSGRPRPESYLENSHDPNEWRAYLVKAGILKGDKARHQDAA